MGYQRSGESRRAYRRERSRVAKARAARILRRQGLDAADVERIAPRVADHLAGCRCPGCANQRPFEGPTVQERRAAQSEE